MRLTRYHSDDISRSGVLDDGFVVDVSASLEEPDDMMGLIDLIMGPGLPASALAGPRVPLAEVTLLAPLRPRKNVFAVGKNFIEHVRELPGADTQAEPPPEHPILFSKHQAVRGSKRTHG